MSSVKPLCKSTELNRIETDRRWKRKQASRSSLLLLLFILFKFIFIYIICYYNYISCCCCCWWWWWWRVMYSDTVDYLYLSPSDTDADMLLAVGIVAGFHVSVTALNHADGSHLSTHLVSAPWIKARHTYVIFVLLYFSIIQQLDFPWCTSSLC